jgi:hypothetical protein
MFANWTARGLQIEANGAIPIRQASRPTIRSEERAGHALLHQPALGTIEARRQAERCDRSTTRSRFVRLSSPKQRQAGRLPYKLQGGPEMAGRPSGSRAGPFDTARYLYDRSEKDSRLLGSIGPYRSDGGRQTATGGRKGLVLASLGWLRSFPELHPSGVDTTRRHLRATPALRFSQTNPPFFDEFFYGSTCEYRDCGGNL